MSWPRDGTIQGSFRFVFVTFLSYFSQKWNENVNIWLFLTRRHIFYISRNIIVPTPPKMVLNIYWRFMRSFTSSFYQRRKQLFKYCKSYFQINNNNGPPGVFIVFYYFYMFCTDIETDVDMWAGDVWKLVLARTRTLVFGGLVGFFLISLVICRFSAIYLSTIASGCMVTVPYCQFRSAEQHAG